MMGRPIGVRLIALLLLGSSLLALSRSLMSPGVHRGRELVVSSVVLAVLALVAAEAMWNLRSHAFMMYMLWALCSMITAVLFQLSTAASAHPVRILPAVVYTGVVYAAAALYLRRAL